MGGAEQLFRVVPLPSPMRERKSCGPSNARLPNGSVKARRVSGGVLPVHVATASSTSRRIMDMLSRPDNTGSHASYATRANCGDPATCSLGIHQCPSGAVRERGHHVLCGEAAIVKWISSESVRAPIFFMAVARWVSMVLWLMPRT